MFRTAVGEQWGVEDSFRGRRPPTLPNHLLFVTCPLRLIICLALVCPPAFAQDDEEEPKGLDTVVEALSISDQSLQDIATLLSEFGGVNLNVAATAPQVRVALNVVTPKTIRQILEDLATQYNLWIDYQEDNILIRPASEKPPPQETILEKDFQLNFSRPSEVIDLVTNLLSDRPQADAIALDDLRIIRVRDIPEAIARIEEFLSSVDVPQQSSVFRILYGDPELIAEIIQERIPDLEEGAITVDTVNSQLIVRTTLDNLAEIQLLIETLDIKKEIRVFHIGFHDVDDVIAVLEDLNLLSAEATLASNPFTGTLIVQDTPERLDLIAEAIRAYDRPRPMVFFEAEIVDVNANYSFNWNPTVALRDAAFGASATDTEDLSDGETMYNLSGSGAFRFAHLNAGDYLAQLQANENESDVHTIASPRVLVEMQEEARLNVGSEEPFGVRSFRTDRFGVGSDIVTQRVREVGVRLIIFVRSISERGYVEFNVALENSANGGRVPLDNQGTTGLRVLTTNVETWAIVKDGRTLVLGGLLERRKSDSDGGIPFFQKVPGLRYLFSTMEKTDDRRKLLLFLTPHILNIDFPHDKYMGDDDTSFSLDREEEPLSSTETGDTLLTTLAGAPSDQPQWIHRNGRWGYLDSEGRFVDKTDLYLKAYQSDEGSGLLGESFGSSSQEGFREPLEEIPPSEDGPSAAELLRELTQEEETRGSPHPETPAQDAPSENVRTHESAAQLEEVSRHKPPETKPSGTTEKPRQPQEVPKDSGKQEKETVPRPATSKKPIPKGRDVLKALDKPADAVGRFKGPLKDLLARVRQDTGVLFSRAGVPLDAEVEVEGRGKTYNRLVRDALKQVGLRFLVPSGKVPIIRKAPKLRKPTPVPKTEDKKETQSRGSFGESFPWNEKTGVDPTRAPVAGYEEFPGLSEATLQPVRETTRASVAPPPPQPWEVPLEVSEDEAARDRRIALPPPPGFGSERIRDEVWDSLLESDLSTLKPPREPSASLFRLSRHLDSYNAGAMGGKNPANIPTVRYDTAAYMEEKPRKKGAWSKIKGLISLKKKRSH